MKTNRILQFAQMAYQVAQNTLPDKASKFAPGVFTQPQLLACLLLKEYLRHDYRTMQEVLELSVPLQTMLALRRVPDYSTLAWFATQKVTPEVIQTALEQTLACLSHNPPPSDKGEPTAPVAVDSTGLYQQQASRYFEWRTKRDRKQCGWLKWALCLCTKTQMLLAQKVRPAPAGDFPDLIPLVEAARKVQTFSTVVADAGYDSESNHVFCRDTLGVESLIPARLRRSKTVVATTKYRQLMHQQLALETEPGKKRLYNQRAKAETVMSVAKRKWGEKLTARREEQQRRQALLRGVVYNLHRLQILGMLWVWWPNRTSRHIAICPAV